MQANTDLVIGMFNNKWKGKDYIGAIRKGDAKDIEKAKTTLRHLIEKVEQTKNEPTSQKEL